MDLQKSDLSEYERSLLVDMTDFDLPLWEIHNDFRFSLPELSSVQSFEVAIESLLSLYERGLIVLQRAVISNSDESYQEPTEITTLSLEEIKEHLSVTRHWLGNDATSKGEYITFGFIPTELGEQMLDLIFEDAVPYQNKREMSNKLPISLYVIGGLIFFIVILGSYFSSKNLFFLAGGLFFLFSGEHLSNYMNRSNNKLLSSFFGTILSMLLPIILCYTVWIFFN